MTMTPTLTQKITSQKTVETATETATEIATEITTEIKIAIENDTDLCRNRKGSNTHISLAISYRYKCFNYKIVFFKGELSYVGVGRDVTQHIACLLAA
jgi:hypothetical protein